MKKITAVVRAEKLEVLKDALFAADVRGMTISQVQGCGALILLFCLLQCEVHSLLLSV